MVGTRTRIAPVVPTISENWSGYAATSGKKFNYVHSTFVQPAITCPGVKNEWTSNWVGLDGFDNATERNYTGWPDRLYVIDREGRVAYKARPGPFGFKPQGVADTLATLVPGPKH